MISKIKVNTARNESDHLRPTGLTISAHTSDSRSLTSPILTALPVTLQLLLKEAAHLQSTGKLRTRSVRPMGQARYLRVYSKLSTGLGGAGRGRGRETPELEPTAATPPCPELTCSKPPSTCHRVHFIFSNQQEMFLCKGERAHMTFTYLFSSAASAEISNI